MLHSINPANSATIASYPIHTSEEANHIIQQTAKAQKAWEITGFGIRKQLMIKASEILLANKEAYALRITHEMGKPIAQARAEVEKCANVCSYYAQQSESFLANEIIETEASLSYIAYRPLGVVLAIMPWNFPFWQVFRFAAPALMAGNGALLKHASNVTGCALDIAGVFRQAGFPEDLFNVLQLPGKQAGEVIGNTHIKAVSLTGSVGAGRAIASKAGSMLKKTVLELGGSDPYLILKDADLEMAVDTCVTSRLINGGQSCIAAKRFIVEKPVKELFEQGMVETMKKKVMGNPMDEHVEIGPQANVQLRDELHAQVTKSIEMGARCLLGGEIPAEEGAWYPPTILTGVKPGMPAFDEELFGPVAAIVEARDAVHAIELANQTVFGLGAAVFTRDEEKGRRIAEESLQAGCCFVNAMVQSDPRLPFGGIGDSGYGRELSHLGIREFTNIKTVYKK